MDNVRSKDNLGRGSFLLRPEAVRGSTKVHNLARHAANVERPSKQRESVMRSSIIESEIARITLDHLKNSRTIFETCEWLFFAFLSFSVRILLIYQRKWLDFVFPRYDSLFYLWNCEIHAVNSVFASNLFHQNESRLLSPAIFTKLQNPRNCVNVVIFCKLKNLVIRAKRVPKT